MTDEKEIALFEADYLEVFPSPTFTTAKEAMFQMWKKARAAPQPATPLSNSGESNHVGWLWREHGWAVTAHSKNRCIKTSLDVSPPPLHVQRSPDFIEMRKVYASKPPSKPQLSDEWIDDPNTIPTSIIEACRSAICKEFGNNGTDGYYKRILAKVFSAIAESAILQADKEKYQQSDELKNLIARAEFVVIDYHREFSRGEFPNVDDLEDAIAAVKDKQA